MQNIPIYYFPHWLNSSEASQLFSYLIKNIPWQEETIFLFGKLIKVPRLITWIGDANCIYTYSKIKHYPKNWIPALNIIRHNLNEQFNTKFNSVLCNLYRTGNDYMGWHQDNEAILGQYPTIASISLGAERKFVIRHKKMKERLDLVLGHGSLLIMHSDCQENWQHSLPKTAKCYAPRINLTFRTLLVDS